MRVHVLATCYVGFLQGKCSYPHFTGDKTKSQRGSVTCPKSHRYKMAEQGSGPRLTSKVYATLTKILTSKKRDFPGKEPYCLQRERPRILMLWLMSGLPFLSEKAREGSITSTMPDGCFPSPVPSKKIPKQL